MALQFYHSRTALFTIMNAFCFCIPAALWNGTLSITTMSPRLSGIHGMKPSTSSFVRALARSQYIEYVAHADYKTSLTGKCCKPARQSPTLPMRGRWCNPVDRLTQRANRAIRWDLVHGVSAAFMGRGRQAGRFCYSDSGTLGALLPPARHRERSLAEPRGSRRFSHQRSDGGRVWAPADSHQIDFAPELRLDKPPSDDACVIDGVAEAEPGRDHRKNPVACSRSSCSPPARQ